MTGDAHGSGGGSPAPVRVGSEQGREAVGEQRQRDRGGASRRLWIPPNMKEWRVDGKIP
jgi:hypothetical protein